MSTPEARLSAAERAALADLEMAASAADPHFAARLRGRAPVHALPALRAVHRRSESVWNWALARGWWGAPTTVVGLFLVVLGVADGFAVSAFGLLLALVGLRLLAEVVERRWLSAAARSRASGD